MNNDEKIKEYEAHQTPVPSYEEWIGVKQQRDLENKLRHDSDNKNWQLRTENTKLKKLLEEVKDYLPEFETPMDILAKIDEALQ